MDNKTKRKKHKTLLQAVYTLSAYSKAVFGDTLPPREYLSLTGWNLESTKGLTSRLLELAEDYQTWD